MSDVRTVEARLQAVDQLEIQSLAAKFSNAVNERDEAAFKRLWASEKPVWEIGPPLASRAEGIDDIAKMLRGLLQIEQYFMQMTHAGVVEVDGDRATARFVVREHGKGATTFYDNLAVYEDVLVREDAGWRFAHRSYRYRFLDQNPFSGSAFPVA